MLVGFEASANDSLNPFRWSEESESADCMLGYASAEQLQLSLESPKISDSPMPQLSEYQALVNGFNTRTLTYPEDALSAFAGVATRLGNKFSGGLISGLPELFFDVCLLWRPQRRKGPPSRRHSSRSSKLSSVIPSWSWAGWDTEVTWPFTWNCLSELAAPFAIDVRPFYQIEISHIDAKLNKRPINNVWASYAYSALSSKDSLPPGWREIRGTLPRGTQHSEHSSDPKYYTHASDPSVHFWFPVPICNVPATPRNVKMLSFTTFTGQFKLGVRLRFTTTVLTLDGSPAGTIWQHDESDPSYVKAIEDGSTIELVAILGCTVPKDYYQVMMGTFTANAHAKESSKVSLEPPSRIQEVYAVIWVQWDDDGKIASRKGTGYIDRRAWENCSGQHPVDILLE